MLCKWSGGANLIFLAVGFMLTTGCSNSGTEEKLSAMPTLDVYAVGIREPKTIAAQTAPIDDDDLVIGIEVDGQSRAYLVDALSPLIDFHADNATSDQLRQLGRHVVNDVVGRVPITVTYCDVNGCSRVFVGEGSQSLDIAVAGTREGQLELALLRNRFLQNDPAAPVKDYPFKLVRWAEWKSVHPETDVYVGPYID